MSYLSKRPALGAMALRKAGELIAAPTQAATLLVAKPIEAAVKKVATLAPAVKKVATLAPAASMQTAAPLPAPTKELLKQASVVKRAMFQTKKAELKKLQTATIVPRGITNLLPISEPIPALPEGNLVMDAPTRSPFYTRNPWKWALPLGGAAMLALFFLRK